MRENIFALRFFSLNGVIEAARTSLLFEDATVCSEVARMRRLKGKSALSDPRASSENYFPFAACIGPNSWTFSGRSLR